MLCDTTALTNSDTLDGVYSETQIQLADVRSSSHGWQWGKTAWGNCQAVKLYPSLSSSHQHKESKHFNQTIGSDWIGITIAPNQPQWLLKQLLQIPRLFWLHSSLSEIWTSCKIQSDGMVRNSRAWNQGCSLPALCCLSQTTKLEILLLNCRIIWSVWWVSKRIRRQHYNIVCKGGIR